MKKLLMGAAALFLISASIYLLRMAFDSVKIQDKTSEQAKNTLKDKRDRQTYKTVKIGEQVWMAENLNYRMDDSWCYTADPANCNKYGRLYTWEAAMKGCPTGWHLPTDDEWQQLIDYLGGYEVAGRKMKSITGRVGDTATNSSGFSGLPGGSRADDGYGGYFAGLGLAGYWWSATESGAGTAGVRSLYYYDANVIRYNNRKRSGVSVRCVRD